VPRVSEETMYALSKLMFEVWAVYEPVALEEEMKVWYMVETVQLVG